MSFDLYMGMGTVCHKNNEFSEAIEHFSKALLIAEKTTDALKQFKVREKLARCYYRLNDIVGALRHLTLLELSAPSDDDLIRVISLKGICLNKLGKFDQAIKTIESLERFNAEVAQRKMLLNLGSIYMRRGQFLMQQDDLTIASKYLFAALEATTDEQIYHKIYRNLGICFNYKGNFLQSLHYFDKALEFSNNEENLITYTYHEMANSYINLGNTSKAQELLTTCYEVASRLNDLYALGLTFTQLGHLHFKNNNITEGEDCFHNAIGNFLIANSFAEISDCYKNLKDYFLTINPRTANIYQRQYEHYLHKIAL